MTASRRATLAAAAVVVAVLALPLVGAFRAPGAPMEEGKLLTAGELVLDGRWPHVDFEHFYGPGDVWSVAASFLVLGPSVGAERAVGLLSTVALLAAIFAIARRWGAVTAAVATVTAGVIVAPFGVHAYSWTTGLALVLWGLVLLTSARLRPVLGGVALGLALLWRADLVLAVAAVLAVVVPGLPAPRRRSVLLGVAGGLSPYLLHLVLVGPRAMVDGMIVSPLFRLRGGRSLPVPPPGGDLTAWFDLSAPKPSPSRLFPSTPLVTQFRAFFWLTILAVLALLAAGAVAWFRNRTDRLLPALGLVAVAITPQMLQRADVTHVRFVAVVALALAPGAVAVAAGLLDRRLPVRLAAAELSVLAVAGLVLLAPQYVARLTLDQSRRAVGAIDVATVENRGRSFPVRSPDVVPFTQALIDRVDELAPDGGRLFVGPQDLTLANYSDAYLYFLFPQLEPASFYLESNTGIANREGSGLADDIREADVLVLSREFDNWDEPNASRDPGPTEPREVVDEEFCVRGTFEVYEIRTPC